MAKNIATAASQLLHHSVRLHQQGDLAAAEKGYQKVLKKMPRNADALHLYGLLLRQKKLFPEAALLLQRATALNPGSSLFWNSLAEVKAELGLHNESIAAYQQQLQLTPMDIKPWLGLAAAQHAAGQLAAAATSYRHALTLDNHSRIALLHLGNLMQSCGDSVAAETLYRQLLVLDPNDCHVLNNLGKLLSDREEWRDATICLQQSLAVSPEFVPALVNLGNCYLVQGEFLQALEHFNRALTMDKQCWEALHGCGQIYSARADFSAALGHYQQALRLAPDAVELLNSCGNLYLALNKFELAQQHYQRVLAIAPQHCHALFNSALLLLQQRQIAAASSLLQKLLATQPNYHQAKPYWLHLKRQLLDWDGIDALAAECRELLRAGVNIDLPPFSFITLPDSTALEQRAIAQHWVKRHARNRDALLPAVAPITINTIANTERRLRIGYLSADVHSHATAWLLARVIELHGRAGFEVFAYSYGPADGSVMRARLEQGFDHFHDISALSHRAVAEKIRADGIDVLLDVKGYTQHSRPHIMALRPAPVQVNYLAYPATMGADFIDYIVTDHYLTPPDQQQYFDERFAYLPDCYQPADDQRPLPLAPERATLQLPAQAFVFAAFHQAYKITPPLLDNWSDILRKVPHSVLWLLADNESFKINFLRELALREVAPERVIFAEKCAQNAHLQRLAAADLILDSFPVNGHTSTADALWAGVPVLTMSADTMISRVAGSLLKTVGLPELIAGGVPRIVEG